MKHFTLIIKHRNGVVASVTAAGRNLDDSVSRMKEFDVDVIGYEIEGHIAKLPEGSCSLNRHC